MLLIIDGLPHCGQTELATAVATALEWKVPLYQIGTCGEEGILGRLRRVLDGDQAEQPAIVCGHLLEAAGVLADAAAEGADIGFTPGDWHLLDRLARTRGAILVGLIDTPGEIQARMAESLAKEWPTPRLGRWIQAVNHALQASSIEKKGTYRLRQFLDRETGQTTWQFDRLLAVVRGVLGETNG